MPVSSINRLSEYERRVLDVEIRKGTPSSLIAKWINADVAVVRRYRIDKGYEYERMCWTDNLKKEEDKNPCYYGKEKE